MSVRYEYMEAFFLGVEVMNEQDLYGAEAPADRLVLVLSADEATVVTGTLEQLENVGQRIITAVKNARLKADPMVDLDNPSYD